MIYYNSYGQNFSQGIGKGFRTSFFKGSALTKLIYINCGVFLVATVAYIPFMLAGFRTVYYDVLTEWLGVPADPEVLLHRPWTLFTYMFTHFGFLHLLFNMLWLFWFGSMFLRHFSERQLTGVYLWGGVAGAALYIVSYNVFPYFDEITRISSWAVGASASVMAIVFAVCVYLPRERIYIFLIGPVKLVYLALFTALIDFLSIGGDNAGGHIAHLGGALFGCCFAMGIRSGKDFFAWLPSFHKKKRKHSASRTKMKVEYRRDASSMSDREYNEYKKRQDERINSILDKISRSGYESLTREEKEYLFKSGRN